jgi:hypothetical protein
LAASFWSTEEVWLFDAALSSPVTTLSPFWSPSRLPLRSSKAVWFFAVPSSPASFA